MPWQLHLVLHFTTINLSTFWIGEIFLVPQAAPWLPTSKKGCCNLGSAVGGGPVECGKSMLESEICSLHAPAYTWIYDISHQYKWQSIFLRLRCTKSRKEWDKGFKLPVNFCRISDTNNRNVIIHVHNAFLLQSSFSKLMRLWGFHNGVVLCSHQRGLRSFGFAVGCRISYINSRASACRTFGRLGVPASCQYLH